MWSTLVSALAIVAGVSAFPLNGKRSLYPRSGIDYCAQAYNASLQTDYGYFPSSLALKCLQQLPYDQAVAEATIDSFIKMFAFYAPESYVIKSPNPDVGLSVDIASQLQSIKQSFLAQKYSYFEYQYALANLVKSLNDGHTGYSDGCSRGFRTRVPLPVVLLSADGQQSPDVYVAPSIAGWEDGPSIFAYVKAIYSIDVNTLLGQKILSINGLDPLSYLESQSDMVAYTQASTRINEVVASYSLDSSGNYQLNAGVMVNRAWPTESSITVVFESSGTINIPVLSKAKDYYPDLNTYLISRCVLTNGTSSGTNSTNSTASSRLRRRQDIPTGTTEEDPDFTVDGDYVVTPTPEPSDPTDPFNIGTPLTSGRGLRTYQLDAPYQNVGVIYVGAFAAQDSFRNALLSGLDQMNSSGVTKLIIEVSGNGGGSVANGQYLQAVLFPDKYPGFPTEARAPQLAIDCAANIAAKNGTTESNMYNYGEYCKLSSKDAGHCIPLQSNDEWLGVQDKVVINGVSDAFSQKVLEQSEPLMNAALKVSRTERQFQPQDIVIVSNGMCGSMCSYTTAWFYEVLGIQTFSFGGLPGQEVETSGGIKGDYPMPLSASQGNTDLWSMMTECGMTGDPAMPGKLLYNGALLQVEARNGISYLQPQYGIREFTYEPGNRTFYTLDSWNRPRKIWEYVAQNYFFNTPTPPSSSSAQYSTDYSTQYLTDYSTQYLTDFSTAMTSTTSATGTANPTQRSAITTGGTTGIPTAIISASVTVLTKTIIETICEGGSVIFQTKTYGGECTHTYLVRPTYAAHVEVQIAAWPYTGPQGSSSNSQGSQNNYASGAMQQGSQSGQGNWYFNDNGQRYWGQSADGYDIVIIEEHVIWVGEVVTTVDRPGTVMINDIQVHISVAPSTITYSTTQVSTRTRTETATVTSGLNLSRPPTASPSAALDPSAFNSTSLNSTGVNATVSDVELEHKLKRRLKALLA